jgi:SAM-dependent methyltransferase
MLAFRSDETHPLVDALLASLGIAPATLERAIDARDEMLGFLAEVCEGDRGQALFQYFRTGASIAESLGQVLRWRFGIPSRIGRLLDFASGYGRVTRFLVREVPPERVWVADVVAEAVRFQEERLGARGIVSTLRPEELSCRERFDAILVTSLFTHLPRERFVDWLRVLLGLLAPGGLLVFTVHSSEVLPPGIEMPGDGFYFQENSESGSLATSDYGSTWVTAGFVRSAVESAAGPGVSLHRIERGLCDFQDLYLAVREPGADFSSLCFHGEPLLFLEGASLSAGGLLQLDGWAASRSGAVQRVEAMLDGIQLASTSADAPRTDVAARMGERYLRTGWLLASEVPAGISRSSAVLLLRVVDARGVAHPLWAGSLDAVLLQSWRNEATRLDRLLRHTETVLEIEQARAKVEIDALRVRIAAMRASRFWKIRDAWFRCKKLLGLVDEI